MIFKETGNYKIHRLRVIHIYEADFNLLLAVKWRQLIQSADLHGLINEGLFGGRPGCEAQSLTFLEELKYDVSIITRRTLFHFDNDATSCCFIGFSNQPQVWHALQSRHCPRQDTGAGTISPSHHDRYFGTVLYALTSLSHLWQWTRQW